MPCCERQSTAGHGPAPHKDFSALYGKMSGRGESAVLSPSPCGSAGGSHTCAVYTTVTERDRDRHRHRHRHCQRRPQTHTSAASLQLPSRTSICSAYNNVSVLDTGTDRHTHGQTDRHTDTQTGTQADTQTDTQTGTRAHLLLKQQTPRLNLWVAIQRHRTGKPSRAGTAGASSCCSWQDCQCSC